MDNQSPPQQNTPKSIGYNCEWMAEEIAEALAIEPLKMDYTEPFAHITHKQLSWSFLNKRDSNLPVMREIYFFQLNRKNKESFSTIILIDSTPGEGGCQLSSKTYRAFDDVDTDKDDLLTIEKDNGARISATPSPHNNSLRQ